MCICDVSDRMVRVTGYVPIVTCNRCIILTLIVIYSIIYRQGIGVVIHRNANYSNLKPRLYCLPTLQSVHILFLSLHFAFLNHVLWTIYSFLAYYLSFFRRLIDLFLTVRKVKLFDRYWRVFCSFYQRPPVPPRNAVYKLEMRLK